MFASDDGIWTFSSVPIDTSGVSEHVSEKLVSGVPFVEQSAEFFTTTSVHECVVIVIEFRLESLQKQELLQELSMSL